MKHQVATVRTALDPQGALIALWEAHTRVIGGPCPIALIGTLGAHTAFETARWRSMFNWNPGNRGGYGEDGAWATFRGATEVVNGIVVPRPYGEAGGFGSWPTKEAGFDSYLRFLGVDTDGDGKNLYAPAWAAALVADIPGFCKGLKAAGYFTDGLDHYTHWVGDCYSWLTRGPLPEFVVSLTPTERPPAEPL